MKFSNAKAYRILEKEGIGYAVTSYCNAEDFEDPKLVQLWANAKKALEELEEYIENHKDDIDE